MGADSVEHRERWPTTASVAAFLEWTGTRTHSTGDPFLILIEKRQSGLLGLPAGKLERGETLVQAMWRELKEETGLDSSRVEFQPLQLPVCIPLPTYTSVGIIFFGHLDGDFAAEGYAVDSQEISRVRRFSVEDLLDLVETGNCFYRPEFNLTLIRKWLYDHFVGKYGTFEGQDLGRSIALGHGLQGGILYPS